MTSRSRLALIALIALLLLAFPLLSSVFGGLFTSTPLAAPTATRAALNLTPTPTSLSAPSSTPSPSNTATATPTVTSSVTTTPTPTATSTPTFTPTATLTLTATPRPRVYLFPFREVFAVGQPQPSTSTEVQMYEGGNDIFEIIATLGASVRLQTFDASLNFWTASENTSTAPPPAALYDYSVRGKTAKLAGSSVFACVYNNRPTLAFGACQQLNGFLTATLIAHISAETTSLYLVDLNGTQYVIPSSAVTSIQ